MSRGTEKPCHGCGQSVWHRVGQVCGDCQKLLEEARWHRRQTAAIEKKPYYMALNAPGYSRTLGDLGDRAGEVAPHWNPYIYVPGIGSGDAIRKAFWQLVRQCAEWRPDLPSGYVTDEQPVIEVSRRGSAEYQSKDVVLMDPATRDALQRLYDALLSTIDTAYAAGKREGASILLNLASGELAQTDFEKRVG